MDTQNLIAGLERYKYFVIFPLAMFEGPIITLVAGFLAAHGFVNFGLAYLLIVIADLCGDVMYFSLGRFGGWRLLQRYGGFIGLSAQRLEKLKRHFDKHAYKTLVLGKFAHGLGNVVLVSAGIAKVSYRTLMSSNIWTTALKSLILMALGFYFGRALVKLNSYLNYFSLATVIGLSVLYIAYLRKKAASQIEEKV